MNDSPIGAVMVVQLDMGLSVHVRMLSPLFMRGVVIRAETVFPLPDPTPYEVEIQGSLTPNAKLPAEENPEYQLLFAKVMATRNDWIKEQFLKIAVDAPDEDKKRAIEHYKQALDDMRTAGIIPSDDTAHDFYYCLIYFIAQDSDINTLLKAAQQKSFLSESEVVGNLKFFRMDTRQDTP